MSEIEKMYKLAQVANIGYDAWDKKDMYPPFTAEKQLELIKWLIKNDKFHCLEIEFFIKEKDYKISTYQKASNFNEDFTETLASLINNHWQDLTEEEKQQIRGILNG